MNASRSLLPRSTFTPARLGRAHLRTRALPWLALAITLALIAADRLGAWLWGSTPLLASAPDGAQAGLLAVWIAGHCDSMDGPVIAQAKKAIASGNVNLVLPWVQPADEANIRAAFEHTLAVRKLGPQAAEMADMYFFETLVRVHRAGEGAPYRGIRPAGTDLGPAIPAADRALQDGSPDAVLELLNDAIRKGLGEHLHAARRRRSYDPDDVAAGRAYVEAYVPYIHYVEGLWHAATGGAHEHHAHEHEHE